MARMSTGRAAVAAAYTDGAAAWQAGPGKVYDRMAEALVAASAVGLQGRLVLDVGAGTGAASRAVRRAGGHPIACDVAVGMLAEGRRCGGAPGVAADARALPVPTAAFGALVAACSFNHLDDPEAALAEAARAVAPGGPVLASAYAHDDHHPAKEAVDRALAELGWAPPPWVEHLRRSTLRRLATVQGARGATQLAGLRHVQVTEVEVALPELTPSALVDWRLGMAQAAPFVASLDPRSRLTLRRRAVELLGHAPPLVRRMIVIAAVV